MSQRRLRRTVREDDSSEDDGGALGPAVAHPRKPRLRRRFSIPSDEEVIEIDTEDEQDVEDSKSDGPVRNGDREASCSIPELPRDNLARVDAAAGVISVSQDEGGESTVDDLGSEGIVTGDVPNANATPETSLTNAVGDDEALSDNDASQGTQPVTAAAAGVSERALKAAEASAVAIRAKGKGKSVGGPAGGSGRGRRRRVLEEDDNGDDNDRYSSDTGGLLSSRDSVRVDLKLDAEGPRSSPSTVGNGAASAGGVAVSGKGRKGHEKRQEQEEEEEDEEEEACWAEENEHHPDAPRAVSVATAAAASTAAMRGGANDDMSSDDERTFLSATMGKGKGKGKEKGKGSCLSSGRRRRRLVTSDCSSDDENDGIAYDSAAAAIKACERPTRNRGAGSGSTARRARGEGVKETAGWESGQESGANAASSGAQSGREGQRRRQRPVRAAASMGVNYAALHEGAPLEEDESEDGANVDGVVGSSRVIDVHGGDSDEEPPVEVARRKRKRRQTSSKTQSTLRSKPKSQRVSHEMRDFIARSSSSEGDSYSEDDGQARKNGDDSDEDARSPLPTNRTRASATSRTAAAIRQPSTSERGKRKAGTTRKPRSSPSRALEYTHEDVGGRVGGADTSSEEDEVGGGPVGLKSRKCRRRGRRSIKEEEEEEENKEDVQGWGEGREQEEEGSEEEAGEEEEESEVEENPGALLYQQMQEDEPCFEDTVLSMTSATQPEEDHESSMWHTYLEFLAKAVQGGGQGAAFMEKFDSKRHTFPDYRKAVKKFEGHVCTIRESIAAGGSWNQEFMTAVSKYPFVGFHFRDGCDEDELGDIKWDSAGRPDECAACHRRERANVSTMYLAGHRDGYRSKEFWTRSRWDKLLPTGWDSAAATRANREKVHERLRLGGTCRFKSHLYHTLLHYKLYLVCKVRDHMDTTGVGPEALREGLWAQQKWDDEKIAIDQLVKRAKYMANMKTHEEYWREGTWEKMKAIRMWLYIPLSIVEEQEAKHDRRTALEQLDEMHSSMSNDSDSSSSSSSSQAPSARRKASAEGRGRARRGRYGEEMSSDGQEWETLSDFIVDDDVSD